MKKINWAEQKQQAVVFEQKFYLSIKIFLYICQVFCAAPSTIDYNSISRTQLNLSRREKCKNTIHFVWCVIVLTSITTSTYFQYSEFDTNNITFLTRILYFGEYISGIFNSAVIIIGCHYQRRWYTLYFRRFSEIYATLEQFDGKVDFVKLKKYLRKSLIVYGIFFLCVIITDFMYNRLSARGFFRSSTVYSIPNIISCLALTEYFILLLILKDCYRIINQILTDLPSKYNWLVLDRHYVVEQKKANDIFNMILKNSTQFKAHGQLDGGASGSGDSCQMIIERLRQLCLKLTEINKDINASFGLLVISVIVSTFLILSIQFYAFYKIFEGFEEDDTWLTIYTALWIILHGAKSFMILLFNHYVNDEVS